MQFIRCYTMHGFVSLQDSPLSAVALTFHQWQPSRSTQNSPWSEATALSLWLKYVNAANASRSSDFIRPEANKIHTQARFCSQSWKPMSRRCFPKKPPLEICSEIKPKGYQTYNFWGGFVLGWWVGLGGSAHVKL